MKKKIALLFLFFMIHGVEAGIIETVHNQEINAQFAGGSEFEGVCAYCHIPHSAKGAVLWRYEMETRDFGKIGNLCYSCHGTNRAGTRANKSFTVFNFSKDNHPIVNANNIEPNLENSDWIGNEIDTNARNWSHVGDGIDIECSTCHNPHDNRSGRFLNAPLFDSTAAEGGYNYEGRLQNFCSYCHQKRESSHKGNKNEGTHPVGKEITNEGLPGIIMDTSLFANPFGVLGGHLSSGTTGGVICVTCHSPHGVPNSNDGLYANGQALNIGPLLVVDNDTTKQSPDSTDIPHGGGGQSLLCEACHGKSPYTKDTTHFSHPVDRYPGGRGSNDNIASSGDTLFIQYPPASWVNYEESGDPNNLQGKGKRSDGEYLVCISCHDPHGGKEKTPILRKGSSVNFCEDCHTNKPAEGENHPVDTVGINLWEGNRKKSQGMTIFRNKDGFEMAILESIEVYDSPGTFITGLQDALKLQNGYVTCRTCHSPHSGVNTRLLTVTDRNSEICESCHTAYENPHNPSIYYFEGPEEIYPGGKANLDPRRDEPETHDFPRMGSHYIGDVTPDRYLYDTFYEKFPDTTDRSGWLSTFVDDGYNTPWADSNQFSHIGGPEADPEHSGYGGTMIICQSCHTPHGAAKGLAHDDGANYSRLLLTSNTGSQLCMGCHYPPGTHPILDNIVTRTDSALNCIDSKFAMGYNSEYYLNDSTMPADYPDTASNGNPQMVCESCHTAHNASKWGGAFIMEASGDSATVPGLPQGEGWFNKRPTFRDHQPLCNRCHLQGIVSGR